MSGSEGFMVVGPSQVDLSWQLTEIQRSRVRDFGLSPGAWRNLPTFESVIQLASALVEDEIKGDCLFRQLSLKEGLQLDLGSSTLGMLCAMPMEIRDASTYVSVLAGIEQNVNPFSSYFDRELQAEGLRHEYAVRPGSPPIGFVLASAETPDRMLASHAGVAVTPPPRCHSPALGVVIDAYELRAPAVAEWFVDHVGSNSTGYLSLGSAEVLTGALRRRIRSLIESGRIAAVSGSHREFARLFSELDASLATPSGFRDHPIRQSVPCSMITFGSDGMAVHWKGNYLHAPSEFVHSNHIVNTSGAGDTAAGRFFAGIALQEEPSAALEDAAALAARVLQVRSSRLAGKLAELSDDEGT